MGLMDNIRGFFSGSKNTQPIQMDSESEKLRLAEKTIDLINKIKRIDSFDKSVWNLSNTTVYELKGKSLDELKNLSSNLEDRLSQLTQQSKSGNQNRAALEESKWTGQKPKYMSNNDFDRLQKEDDYIR